MDKRFQATLFEMEWLPCFGADLYCVGDSIHQVCITYRKLMKRGFYCLSFVEMPLWGSKTIPGTWLNNTVMIMKLNPARVFGVFFILSFISYAIGLGLMETVQDSRALLAEIVESKFSLVSGAILIVVFHTLFNIILLSVMFGVLKFIHLTASVMYLVLGSLATLLLALGALALLMPLSASEVISKSNYMDDLPLNLLLDLALSGNFYAYQFGMITWGVAGLLLCYLLYRSKLVQVVFPVAGFIGYAIFISGCMLELFGLPYGLACSIPGCLFEIGLSTWLIVKGFNNVTKGTRGTNETA